MTRIKDENSLIGQVCEIYQKPATRFAMDIKEIEPVDNWEQWETGDLHFGCEAHEPPAIATRLDGSIE